MAILFSDDTYRADAIFATLRNAMPGVDLRRFPEIGDATEIDYAIIWRPAPGSLQNLPNLKIVFTTSAGVDGIVHDATLPDVPIVRNAAPELVQGIVEYAVYQVLRWHRNFAAFESFQATQSWKQIRQIRPQDRVIGVMGLGEMGAAAANVLTALNFTVRGWSRTPKNIPGITTFHGDAALPAFLDGLDMAINILPLTDATRGILNAEFFAALPKGATIMNIGRGEHLVEQDLLAALDSGHLSRAILDVFPVEPLPADSRLWTHPQVTVTPHIASLTDLPAVAANIMRMIEQFEMNGAVPATVDRQLQY